jgi:hypothetical protein
LSTLAFVSKDTDTADKEDAEESEASEERWPMFSGFGIASAVLGLLCVAAVVLATLIWSTHDDKEDNLEHQARAMLVARNWVQTLITITEENVQANLQKLRDDTVGDLNTNFDARIADVAALVKKLKRQANAGIDSVSLESLHHDLNRKQGQPMPADQLEGLASRTDYVLVIAESVGSNLGGAAQQAYFNFRLGVSDVDGKLLISSLERYG